MSISAGHVKYDCSGEISAVSGRSIDSPTHQSLSPQSSGFHPDVPLHTYDGESLDSLNGLRGILI